MVSEYQPFALPFENNPIRRKMDLLDQDREISILRTDVNAELVGLRQLNRGLKKKAEVKNVLPQSRVEHLGVEGINDHAVSGRNIEKMNFDELNLKQFGHIGRLQELDYLKDKLATKRLDLTDIDAKIKNYNIPASGPSISRLGSHQERSSANLRRVYATFNTAMTKRF